MGDAKVSSSWKAKAFYTVPRTHCFSPFTRLPLHTSSRLYISTAVTATCVHRAPHRSSWNRDHSKYLRVLKFVHGSNGLLPVALNSTYISARGISLCYQTGIRSFDPSWNFHPDPTFPNWKVNKGSNFQTAP